MLTGRDPPFEAALEWLQFTYTEDRAGVYVVLASTVLVPSMVADGGDLFAALLAHLKRQYPEVSGMGENTARSHERRDTFL